LARYSGNRPAEIPYTRRVLDVEPLPRQEIERRVTEAILQTRVEGFGVALEVFERYLPQLAAGSKEEKLLAASAFSYYGLCVARARRRYGDAVRYCTLSTRVQRSRPEHYENLGRVHLAFNNRKKAVEAFFKGLNCDPDDAAINRILDSIGRRREPVLTFLSRDSFLNMWLGRRRYQRELERKQRFAERRTPGKKGKLAAADKRMRAARTRAEKHRLNQ